MRKPNIVDWTKSAHKLPGSDLKMPVLFVGHGSPMNAIEENDFTRTLNKLGVDLPHPKAILCISAHWATRGTFVNISPKPKMIYDMYGFPKELYEVQYKANGSPETAREIQELISSTNVQSDTEWGFDHGNWSVMTRLFPQANIPLFQMSIDYYKPMSYHYELAKQLKALRKKGVLIIGSGNITHNLQVVDIHDINAKPRDWTLEFDSVIKKFIDDKDHQGLINYQHIGKSAQLAVPEPSHYFPLIYTVALQEKDEESSYFYEKFHYGTLSMRGLKIG
ncbi:MAG: 4,5-DOPA dioxygenase extradiol [Calditrichaeota bacterium]|nr:MAG: 4,5-DOPA dioxygenase extradiol [Calditrichota bacterium]MBL1208020.1 4,5-DOPA dioxygenase extradiol [Calditrichota bacterium]NOG47856.1 4,5-DOPA dioxygenase extradiol [Calditrichota bacterium]